MKHHYHSHIYAILMFLCCCTSNSRAQQPQEQPADSVRLSLLTCAAGGEIYSLFGHTAIRYEAPARGIDAVFNYGIFNFNAPHFIFRFALGETDYQLGVTSYDRFSAEYHYLGRDVRQQTLNLTSREKERLIALLKENYLPENRIYRYNFFYDNCATRPRDKIEQAIEGTLQYTDETNHPETGISFRDLLHRYSEGHPWSRFGMDLCMGSLADCPIDRRTMMFVPFLLEESFAHAQIIDKEGKRRPLVDEEKEIIVTGKSAVDFQSNGITPMQAALLLFIIVTSATIYGLRHRKTLWGIDLLLFATAGAAGCILAFLTLFSQHPAVSPNYLLFVLHPLHLCCLPCMLRKIKRGSKSRYMQVNALVLTLFITLWWLFPQKFPTAIVPLALCLLIRSISNLILTYKRPE